MRPVELLTKLLLFIYLYISCCGCNQSNVDKELEHVLAIHNCDSLLVDSIYLKHEDYRWPYTKPKSITEAMILLDSATNEFVRYKMTICDNTDMYFGLGLTIRNQWIRHGTPELSSQLFDSLKINHIDHTSGMILRYYEAYLLDNEIHLADTALAGYINAYGDNLNDTIKQMIRELKKIDSELNNLKLHSR